MPLTRIARSIAAAGLLIFSTSTVLADPPGDGGPRDRERGRDGDRGPRPDGPRDRGPSDRGPRDRGPRGNGPGDRGPGFGGPGGPGRMDPSRFMKMMPVLSALDADGDGIISKDEIDNAAVALRKLDKNDDGRLDFVEMRPNFGERGPGGERPGMRGGRDGFRGGERDGEARDGDRRGQDAQRRPEGDRPRGGRDAGERPQEGRRDGAAMTKRLMQLDKDGDGELTADELPERAKGLLDRLDRDKNGSISKEELARMGQRGPRGGDRD